MMSPELLTAAGFPAAEGWYATQAAPHVAADNKAAQFVRHYKDKYGTSPDDYSITAYDAGLVIVDAVKRLVEEKQPITKSSLRAAIETAKVPTIQGVVSFDENGDIKDRTVSVYQVRKDTTKPLDDVSAQYHYMGVAPQAQVAG